MTAFTSFPINGVTIDNLPSELSELKLTDRLPLVHDGVTIKATLADIQGLFQTTNTSQSSIVSSGDSVSMVSNIPIDLIMLPLPAGTWVVWGNVHFSPSSSGQVMGWTSEESETMPDSSLISELTASENIDPLGFSVPQRIYSLDSAAFVYLSAKAVFSDGAYSVCGGIYALQI